MSGMINVRLVGTLETLSPLSVVGPNAEEIQRPDGGKFKKVVERTIYRDGLRDTVPVLPGSTLRGRLRRSAAEVVQNLLENKPSLAEFHQNAIGGIKGSESEDAFDVVIREELRRLNPILALFGAGAPWMASRARIGDGIPIESVQTEVVGGVRADDGRRDHSFFARLDDDAKDQWTALVNANANRTKYKKQAADLKRELRQARSAKKTENVSRLEEEIEALAQEEAQMKLLATNPVSMPLTHEAMPVGVKMLQRIELTGVTQQEAGLFFAAMNSFAKSKPNLGQHTNVGYGLIRGEYDVFLTQADAVDPFEVGQAAAEPLGTMILEPVTGLTDVPAPLVECMSAFKAAMEAGTYDFRTKDELVEQKVV